MSEKGFNIDIDILEALKKDEIVWANFHKFPPLYQRVRIDTIQIKKKNPQLFQKRLEKLIENTKKGIMYGEWNDNGRLLISKDTLENLVVNIVNGFDGTENVVAKVGLDKENNLRVYVTLYVHPNIVIKDLTASIQNRVKEAIKKTSDLETKAVNVRVRNITPTIENKVEG